MMRRQHLTLKACLFFLNISLMHMHAYTSGLQIHSFLFFLSVKVWCCVELRFCTTGRTFENMRPSDARTSRHRRRESVTHDDMLNRFQLNRDWSKHVFYLTAWNSLKKRRRRSKWVNVVFIAPCVWKGCYGQLPMYQYVLPWQTLSRSHRNAG